MQQAQVPQITKTTVRSDVTPNTLKPEPSQSVIAQPLQRRGATQQQNADNRRGSQRRRKDSENVSEKLERILVKRLVNGISPKRCLVKLLWMQ